MQCCWQVYLGQHAGFLPTGKLERRNVIGEQQHVDILEISSLSQTSPICVALFSICSSTTSYVWSPATVRKFA